MAGDYKKCQTCGQFGWAGSHHCPPLWDVVIDLYDVHVSVYAYDAAGAAEKAVEQWEWESAEFLVAGGQDVEVSITDRDGEVIHFTVSGESVPQYSAHEVVV